MNKYENWLNENADAGKGFIEAMYAQFLNRQIDVDEVKKHGEDVEYEDIHVGDILYFENGYVGVVNKIHSIITIGDRGITELDLSTNGWIDKIVDIKRPN